ncbi:MAG TPA: hypothetical protein VKF32_00320 [Thermoanaerobaculia bacterium]|nr:hypothetical protein [Thermoanaerobaculia bacterium]
MLNRLGVGFLVLAFLAGLGMPLRKPCCPPAELSGPSAGDPADDAGCCPSPDCCRGEKRGPEPVTFSARTDVATNPALTVLVDVCMPAKLPVMYVGQLSEAGYAHSPPRLTPARQAVLSTFRI